MPIIYSLQKLQQIHRNRQGEKGVKYYTEDRVFEGNEKGFLIDITDIKLSTEETVESVEEINENLNNLNTTIVTKSDRCFTMAMAIVL